MNIVAQKLLIAFAFSMLLFGGTSASSAKCTYSVHNHTKHTVKVRLGFANQYQKVTHTELLKIRPGMMQTFDQGAAGNTVKVIDRDTGWVRYRLTALHVPGCFEWIVKKAKIKYKEEFRYLTYLNSPQIGHLKITCNKDKIFYSKCK